jgi:hypothetical protein
MACESRLSFSPLCTFGVACFPSRLLVVRLLKIPLYISLYLDYIDPGSYPYVSSIVFSIFIGLVDDIRAFVCKPTHPAFLNRPEVIDTHINLFETQILVVLDP